MLKLGKGDSFYHSILVYVSTKSYKTIIWSFLDEAVFMYYLGKRSMIHSKVKETVC